MKKMIVESIKQLKKEKEQSKKEQQAQAIAKQQNKASLKRNHPTSDYNHRQHRSRFEPIFSGYSFCFPVIDIQLTPMQIELLSNSIEIEGGRVIKFNDRIIKDTVDFILINPLMKIENIKSKIDGKIAYKQILDYHCICDSLKDGNLRDFEKYSLYINIGELKMQEKQMAMGKSPVKKRKLNESQEDSNKTMKLSDDQPQAKLRQDEQNGQKVDMEEVMLHKITEQSHFSMNKFISQELTKLMKIYETERDIGRKIAYMKAAAVIRSLDKEIQSQRDVENIRGIGDKISKKIKELLTTGKMEKLETLQKSEKNIICGQFCKIWGIGPSKAQQLFNLGLKSIEDLKMRTELLTKNQKVGLKYHEQFQMKIPRQKVTRMFQFVKKAMQKIVPSLDLYRIEVCGSYRRQKPFCGDMDIIISRKDGVYEKHLLQNLVNHLYDIRFLTDHLTHPKSPEGRSSISYMGVCQFEDDIHHRIDIKYYPIEQFSYAILYFTGSGNFNRMIRLHCMKAGLNLSDHGVTPKMEKGVIWIKPIPTCYTEQDIFKFLGFEYKQPRQRDM